MRKLLLYIKQNINTLGAANFFIYVLSRVLQRISQQLRISSYVVVKQPTSQKRMLPKNRGKGIVTKKVAQDDPVVSSFPRPKQEISKRFDNDAHCFVALKNDQFVGYIWVAFSGYLEEEDRSLMVPQPAESTAWDLDIYIDPKERLGFVFPKLWDDMNEFLVSEGRQWTVSRISVFNHGSVSAHKKLGAIVLARIHYFSIGPIQIYSGNLPPYVHLSIRKTDYPTICIKI